MAKRKNPPDATGRNVRHGNKRDDSQDVRFRRLENELDDAIDRIEKLEKKVKKMKKGK